MLIYLVYHSSFLWLLSKWVIGTTNCLVAIFLNLASRLSLNISSRSCSPKPIINVHGLENMKWAMLVHFYLWYNIQLEEWVQILMKHDDFSCEIMRTHLNTISFLFSSYQYKYCLCVCWRYSCWRRCSSWRRVSRASPHQECFLDE